MTFSIVARCERTGMFGVAISSSSPCVAARCAHARAGVGAVATQNITDPRLGPAGLDLLAQGLSADAAITALRKSAAGSAAFRQLAIVDGQGRAAAFSGEACLGLYGHVVAPNAVAAGNMLAGGDIPAAMVEAFAGRAQDHLAERLLGALDAALAGGGEEGPIHSAGLLVVDDQAWPLVDLRIDWAEQPLSGLRDLWRVWRPQMLDYVRRGLDPDAAPSFGVPGNR